jgi:hypothetical protein
MVLGVSLSTGSHDIVDTKVSEQKSLMQEGEIHGQVGGTHHS